MSDNTKLEEELMRETLSLQSDSPAMDPLQADEARMRRALGLQGDAMRQRPQTERTDHPVRTVERLNPGVHKRRFVQDGEVPVTVVHGLISGRRDHGDIGPMRIAGAAAPTNRLEIAETALANEITTRERAERALAEAQAAVHDLRTKLGHADLARQEAVAALRREQDASEALRTALREAGEKAAAAEEREAEAEERLAAMRKAADERAAARYAESVKAAHTAAPRKPGRPRKTPHVEQVEPVWGGAAEEPKPVRWWLQPRRAGKKR